MIEFEKSETKRNLARAFASECQDGAKYQFMAQEAMKAGQTAVQQLLKAAATNEMAHAKIFYDFILEYSEGGADNIEINAGYNFNDYKLNDSLKLMSEVEFSEKDNIYPFFARIAEDEGYKDVATAFKQISQVEDCHYKMLTELYNLLRTGKAYKSPEEKKWKCIKCGYEAVGKESWETCPLCGLDKGSVLIEIGGEEE